MGEDRSASNPVRILMSHGSGGKLSRELVEKIILPKIGNGSFQLDDAAVLPFPHGGHPGQRLAFTTDSYVVNPIFFPGGSIGDLAVNGTVNDLAMMGARPLYITAGLIIEEGFAVDELEIILSAMQARAEEAGISIVAGDTKVVERGHADRIFINTSGVGVVPEDRKVSGSRLEPGDKIILSGTVGDHGMAVLSRREGLEFRSAVESDTAPLNGLVDAVFAASAEIHALRDPTRGGLAATLNEFAAASNVGIVIEEARIPLRPEVLRACELLGLDPLYVANEGKLVASVPGAQADKALRAMRAHPMGKEASIIGEVTAEHARRVILRTGIGGKRVLDMPLGELLPRIC